MSDTITIEFRKLRLSQTKDGHTITFEFDPKGMDALISAPLGTVWMAQLIETESGEFKKASSAAIPSQTVPEPTAQPGGGGRNPGTSLSQQAALRCKDARFQHWLVSINELFEPSEGGASVAVRTLCRVDSRSELIEGTEAGNRWLLLESAYQAWKTQQDHGALAR